MGTGGYSFTGGFTVSDGHFINGVTVIDTQRLSQGLPEQVVRTIDLGRTVLATAATADLSRAFALVNPIADKPPGVYVIDGISLRGADMDRSTEVLDRFAAHPNQFG